MDAEVTDAEFCSGSVDAPVVTFDEDSVASEGADSSEMWAFYEDEYPVQGRNAWLAALAEQWGGEVVQINGAPAYVSPPAEDGARNQIIMTVPGEDQIVRLQAPADVAVDELMDLATAFPEGNSDD